MATGKFEVGEVVRLKSGGPDMTIHSVDTDFGGRPNGGVWCQWFGGRKLERGHFDIKSLLPVDATEEPKK